MSSAKKPLKSAKSRTPGGSGRSKKSNKQAKAKLSAKRTATSTKRSPAPRAAKTARTAAAAKRAATAKRTAAPKTARTSAAKAKARASGRAAATRTARTAAARRSRSEVAAKSARHTTATVKSSKSKGSAKTTAKAVAKPASKVRAKVVQSVTRKTVKAVAPKVVAPVKVVPTKEIPVTVAAVKAAPVSVNPVKEAPAKVVEAKAVEAKTAAVKPAALPGTAAKIMAAFKAAKAKAEAATKLTAPQAHATLQAQATLNVANRGGTTDVIQKAQKKIDAPAAVAPVSAPRPMSGRPGAPFGARPVAPAILQPLPLGRAPDKSLAKPAKQAGNRHGFKTSEFIVYPAHGVGQIVAVEEQEVAGFALELFVISFAKDKMILKVPTPKVASVGMRKLAEAPVVARALETLTGRARIKRTMWSRRAQEYEAKINSGDLISIAEVVRDLYRSDAQPEQSYSERQLYEAAVDRMGREIAAVNKLTETEALKLIEANLQKGPRRGKAEEAEEAEGEDGDIEEAA